MVIHSTQSDGISYQELVDRFGPHEAARIYVELYRTISCEGVNKSIPFSKPNIRPRAEPFMQEPPQETARRQEKIDALLRGETTRNQSVSYYELALRLGENRGLFVYDSIWLILCPECAPLRPKVHRGWTPWPDISWANTHITPGDIGRIEAWLVTA